jgi:RNA polymerase sigma-70 factor (ECF subfamily)
VLVGPRELVERAQHGDRDAFGALAKAAAGRLHAVAYRILRDADLADDALQETLVQAWHDLPGLREPERFEAWSCRILCRTCYRLARQERRRSAVRHAAPPPTAIPDCERDVAARDEIERGFLRLSPDHRAILVLHYYLGLPLGEIAATLGIPPGTAGSRLHYALQSLRGALDSEARMAPAGGAT